VQQLPSQVSQSDLRLPAHLRLIRFSMGPKSTGFSHPLCPPLVGFFLSVIPPGLRLSSFHKRRDGGDLFLPRHRKLSPLSPLAFYRPFYSRSDLVTQISCLPSTTTAYESLPISVCFNPKGCDFRSLILQGTPRPTSTSQL